MARRATVGLLLVMIGSLILADRVLIEDPVSILDPELRRPAPVGSGETDSVDAWPADSSGRVVDASEMAGSTWYCPAGSVTANGDNDHIVIITNRGDEDLTGSITVFPSLVDSQGSPVVFTPAVQPIELGAYEQTSIRLAPIATAIDPLLASDFGAFVGALVEFNEPDIAVEHRLTSPFGSGTAVCSATASTSWWFAAGSTTTGVDYLLYLMNPFATDAVVDVEFLTDDGSRSPQAFQSQLVPARSLVVLDVAAVATVRPQLSTEVTALSGRVIAERVQLFRADDGPTGLEVQVGTPRLSPQWFFPSGRAIQGAGESFVIYNPTDMPTSVELEFLPDDDQRRAIVSPLLLEINERERWVVTVDAHPTHPSTSVAEVFVGDFLAPGERYSARIRSFSGVPIAVERVTTVPSNVGAGVSIASGSAVSSTDQLIAVTASAHNYQHVQRSDDPAQLIVMNTAEDTISRVEVFAGARGEQARVAVAEIGPLERAVFEAGNWELGSVEWLRVTSSTGVTAELVTFDKTTLNSSSGVPAVGSVTVPGLG